MFFIYYSGGFMKSFLRILFFFFLVTQISFAQWVQTSLDSCVIRYLVIKDAAIYAGTWYEGVWRRPLSEMITDVEDIKLLPTEFLLSQNYPNPFNPSTKISWKSPASSWQTLKVYVVLGNEIETLVN
jgi:hypothetical protein